MSNSVPRVLPLLLALEDARASRALDGKTQHEAATRGDCCWEHAMERIAALEALLRRWVEHGPSLWLYTRVSGRKESYHCDRCGSMARDKDAAPGKILHAEGCIVGDTLKALEVESDDDAEGGE